MTALVHQIRKVDLRDSKDISNIYNYYILNSPVTFEEAPLSDAEMSLRIKEISAEFPFFVLEIEGKIVAYAYANTWKTRSAYRFSCESSVYVDVNELGFGYGALIYGHLIEELQSTRYKRIIAGISLPNDSSIKLHEKLGFTYIGTFHQVGFKANQWIDVGYWELLFD